MVLEPLDAPGEHRREVRRSLLEGQPHRTQFAVQPLQPLPGCRGLGPRPFQPDLEHLQAEPLELVGQGQGLLPPFAFAHFAPPASGFAACHTYFS